MKTMKKIISLLIVAVFALQFQLIASAADTINLFVDPVDKTVTVNGESSRGLNSVLGMTVYNTGDAPYPTTNPLTILDCKVDGAGKYSFPSFRLPSGSYLKLLTVNVDMGDNIISKDTAVAFEDTPGGEQISGFASAVTALSAAQVETFYSTFSEFAGYSLVSKNGSYISETYKNMIDLNLTSTLASKLLSKVGTVTTKTQYRDLVKEQMMLVAAKSFPVEELYVTLFSEFGITCDSSDPTKLEAAVGVVCGNDYANKAALIAALNEAIGSEGDDDLGNNDNGPSNVPSGAYTPLGGGAFVKPTEEEKVILPPDAQKPVLSSAFEDIVEHWGEDDINDLVNKKIINGYPDKTFKPDNSVTRAEVATIIKKAFNIEDAKNDTEFSDVKAEDWYYSFINALYENGIMKGDGDAINPNGNLTREDMCVLVYRALGEPEAEGENSFIDKADIADYAVKAIDYLSVKGLVNGYENSFMPKDNITRAQLCAIINRTLKGMAK